jgi:hypothetical protein
VLFGLRRCNITRYYLLHKHQTRVQKANVQALTTHTSNYGEKDIVIYLAYLHNGHRLSIFVFMPPYHYTKGDVIS